jgi:hypothetical protein
MALRVELEGQFVARMGQQIPLRPRRFGMTRVYYLGGENACLGRGSSADERDPSTAVVLRWREAQSSLRMTRFRSDVGEI